MYYASTLDLAFSVGGHRHLLLDPLLALLSVEVPSRAEAALVARHKCTKNLVLPDLGNGLVVTLDGPRPGVELGPVDLRDWC